MEFSIIRDELQFVNERESWTKLYADISDATPFQSWEWNYYWWKNNEPSDSLFVLKAYEGKEVLGYAPLVCINRCVTFIGDRHIDYGRFVVRTKEIAVIQGFIDIITGEKLSVCFQEMSSGNEQLHILQKILEDNKTYYCRKTTRTVFIKTNKYSSLDEYRNALSKNAKNSIRQINKKAEQNNISINVEQANKDSFAEIERIFDNRQKTRGGHSNLSWAYPIISELSSMGILQVLFVRKDENPIAFMIALQNKNGVFAWLTAFSDDAVSLGAGQLLNYYVIANAFERNEKRIDFMRGDYSFKMRWECELDSNYSVYLFRSRIKKIYAKLYYSLREKMKSIVYSNRLFLKIYKKLS